jgi:hypothetical protein
MPSRPAGTALRRTLGVICGTMGLGMVAVAAWLLASQLSQTTVTARVLSKQCGQHPNGEDHGIGEVTLCNATVRFTSTTGRVITASVTGAGGDDFGGTGNSETINLRYNPGDPTNLTPPNAAASPLELVAFFAVGGFTLVVGVRGVLRAGTTQQTRNSRPSSQEGHGDDRPRQHAVE